MTRRVADVGRAGARFRRIASMRARFRRCSSAGARFQRDDFVCARFRRGSSLGARFRRDDSGAALVEFGMILPVLLLFFALSVEGARTFHAYQTTIAGVRDAARYLSRVVPADICDTGGTVSGWNGALTAIVRNGQDGRSLFDPTVRIEGVAATLDCTRGDWRRGSVGVAGVTATLAIDYPFAGLFRFAGARLGDVRTSVADRARVVGS